MRSPNLKLSTLLLLSILFSTLGCARLSIPLPSAEFAETSPPERTMTKPETGTQNTLETPTESPVPASQTMPSPTPEPLQTVTAAPTASPPSEEPAPSVEDQTNTPSPTATALPTIPPVNMDIAVYETSITLNSYGWEQAYVPSTPDKAYYPYPELNFEAVAPPTPRTYNAIILENHYTRLTVLPELGGRILRWEDKLTGNTLTYANPVIKPTHWGYRGWWLGTGGIEWAFPVEEHGLNEYRPWQYELLSSENWRGIRVWDTDDRSGMDISVSLRLYGGRSDVRIIPQISNATAETHPLQFWINAMLTLSGSNAPSNALRFWVPTDTMIVHSTGDGSLPGPRSTINWPYYEGRDFSTYTEWQRYLGLFASEAQGAVGAYDEATKQGVLRTYPQGSPQGVKIFCLGDLSPDLYTDDGSRYFELWGGYNRTFFPEDNIALAPGSTISWEERWYPVHGIHSLSWGDKDIAIALQTTGEDVIVEAYTPAVATHLLRLRQNEAVKAEWLASTSPEAPFLQTYAGAGAGWILEIWEEGTLKAEITPSP